MPRKHFLICSFLKHDFWLLYAANTKNETNRMYMTTYERLDEDLIFILWLYLRTNKQPNWIVPVMIRCFVLLFILSSECSRIQYILTVALGHCCPVICKPDETKSIYTLAHEHTLNINDIKHRLELARSRSLYSHLCVRVEWWRCWFFFPFLVHRLSIHSHCSLLSVHFTITYYIRNSQYSKSQPRALFSSICIHGCSIAVIILRRRRRRLRQKTMSLAWNHLRPVVCSIQTPQCEWF